LWNGKRNGKSALHSGDSGENHSEIALYGVGAYLRLRVATGAQALIETAELLVCDLLPQSGRDQIDLMRDTRDARRQHPQVLRFGTLSQDSGNIRAGLNANIQLPQAVLRAEFEECSLEGIEPMGARFEARRKDFHLMRFGMGLKAGGDSPTALQTLLKPVQLLPYDLLLQDLAGLRQGRRHRVKPGRDLCAIPQYSDMPQLLS